MSTVIDLSSPSRVIAPAGELATGSPEPSDHTLARGAGAGDTAALGELYRRYNRRVYSLCLRMCANPAEAEDLTQEVFIKLYREAGTFRGESAFTTWLHRLTINVVLMYFRKHKRRFERPTRDTEIPEQVSPGTERPGRMPVFDRLELDRALAALPPATAWSSCSSTWRATRTTRSPSSSVVPPAPRSPNCTRRARNCAPC